MAVEKKLTEVLINSNSINIAYETVQLEDGSLPLLTPMSEVAGRMSIQEGAKYLEMSQGGMGVLLGGVPGVEPATIVIIGGGVIGINSAKILCGLGAKVYILDTNIERLRYLDDVMPKNCFVIISNPSNIKNLIKKVHV